MCGVQVQSQEQEFQLAGARFSALRLDLLFGCSGVMDVIGTAATCTGPADASHFAQHMVDLDEPKRPRMFATALEVPLVTLAVIALCEGIL